MKRFLATLLSSSVLLVATGCGGTSNPTPPSSPVGWSLIAGSSAQQEALQGLQFYPNSITINAGDTITWSFPSGEPHTVTFLGPLKAPPPPTDPGAPVPAGGKTYDGSIYTSSGFVLLGKTYALTFTKPGVYPYYCLLHDRTGMTGVVTVNPTGTPYKQSQSTLTAQGATMIASDLGQAAAAVLEFPYTPGGPHVAAGISAGLLTGSNVPSTVVRFLDGPTLASGTVNVHVGDTVTWTNLSSNFPHTVTFGVVGQPFPSLPPFSPPSGGNTYDGSTLVNSGPMFPGSNFSLKFTKAGTYEYHCIFHDDTENMIATVVVT